jgi:hypothetical protein
MKQLTLTKTTTMKTKITLLFALISFLGMGQYSKSYFESLSPTITPASFFSNHKNFSNGFFAIGTNNGALAVRFADSLSTKVQWVKTDLNGADQFYSAAKPNGISFGERIAGLYEMNNFQYIVTSDSMNQFQGKIRIYKYQNYTSLMNMFEYGSNLGNKKIQVYRRNGEFLIIGLSDDYTLFQLRVNEQNMNLIQALDLYQSVNLIDDYQLASRSVHVHFISPNEHHIYTNLGTSLVRISVENNLISQTEIENLNIKKVIGIDTINQNLICTSDGAGSEIKKFQLNATNLNQIQLESTIPVPHNVESEKNDWYYLRDGNHEYFIQASNYMGNFVIFKLTNNSISWSKYHRFFTPFLSNLQIHQNKIFASGAIHETSTRRSFPFISSNTFEQLFDTKFHFSFHQLGSLKIKSGIGSQILPHFTYLSDTLYSFRKKLFTLNQLAVGRRNGEIKGQYGLYFNQFFKPGPYTQVSSYDQEVYAAFNHNFYVDLNMVNQHVSAIQNNDPNYVMPSSIQYWPAHGNVSKGQAENLAFFIDVNLNGIYDPENGDYPSFPGEFCLLNITHQHENDYQNSGLGLEFHTYLYSFDCSNTIDSVLFIRTEIYNRSTEIFDSLFFGFIADFDIGRPQDDFVGTHVENGLIYGYNGDSLDEPLQTTDVYGNSIPAIGLQFLKGNKITTNNTDDQPGISGFQSVNGFGFSDGVIDNEHKGLEFASEFANNTALDMNDPTNSEQWLNYLSGKWRFGAEKHFGWSGASSTAPTTLLSKFDFPNDSDPLHYGTYGVDPGFIWKADTLTHAKGDKRIIGSFGDTKILPNQKKEYHAAIFSSSPAVGFGQALPELFDIATEIKTYFNQNQTPCGQTFDNLTPEMVTNVAEIEQELGVLIYPNPFTDQLTIQLEKESESRLQLFDLQGKKVLQKSLSVGEKTISLRDLEKGIYLLSIETEFGKTTRKVVKI